MKGDLLLTNGIIYLINRFKGLLTSDVKTNFKYNKNVLIKCLIEMSR